MTSRTAIDKKAFPILVVVSILLSFSAWWFNSHNDERDGIDQSIVHAKPEPSKEEAKRVASIPNIETTRARNRLIHGIHKITVLDTVSGSPLGKIAIVLQGSENSILGLTNSEGMAGILISTRTQSLLKFFQVEGNGDGREYLQPTSMEENANGDWEVSLPKFARIHLSFLGDTIKSDLVKVVFLDNRHVPVNPAEVYAMRRRNPKSWLGFIKGDKEGQLGILNTTRKVSTLGISQIDIEHDGDIAILCNSKTVSCQPFFLSLKRGIESTATVSPMLRPVIMGILLDSATRRPLAEWELKIATSAFFTQDAYIPSDERMGSSMRIKRNGDVQSILLTTVTTGPNGRFSVRMPFSGSVAIWNEKETSYTTGLIEHELESAFSNGGPFEILVSKVRNKRKMRLILDGQKVIGLRSAMAIPWPRSPFALRYPLTIVDGNLDVTRLKSGAGYKLTGFTGRSDLVPFVDFTCAANGKIVLESSRQR